MFKVITFYEDIAEYYIKNYDEAMKNEGIEVKYINRRDLNVKIEADVLVHGTLRDREIGLLPNLKAVIVPYTGLDGLKQQVMIDNSIKVFNTSAHAKFVAERAVALILAVMGRVVYFHNELNLGRWNRVNESGNQWTSVYNKKNWYIWLWSNWM